MPLKNTYLFPNFESRHILSLFDTKSLFGIDEIKEWLDENWERYIYVKDNWECDFCPTGQMVGCYCSEPEIEFMFTLVYEVLDEMLRYHRREKYFKDELSEYHRIKNSRADLKIWTAKHEKLVAEEYVAFEYEYLDYDYDDRKNADLRVFGPNKFVLDLIPNIIGSQLGGEKGNRKIGFEIYINRNDFKYTFEFIEVFNDLYWKQEILPESLERINDEMNRQRNNPSNNRL